MLPDHSRNLVRDTGSPMQGSSPRDTEERFQLLVEAVRDYAIFMLDPNGHVATWNTGAERIKGYSAKEIIGSHFSRFYPPEDVAADKPGRELEIALREGRIEDEGWRVRKDGSTFWANVTITALRDSHGKLVGFAKVTRDITEKRKAHEALRLANEELEREVQERKAAEQQLQISEQSLRYLSRHLLRSQDEERKRIGRELHDSVGQYLAVLKMHLDSVRATAGPEGERLATQISKCSALAEDCIKEVRTISYLLYPPMLEEMGLRSAISWYLDGFAQRSGIQTTSDIDADLPRLSRDVELAIFRVLQESLTNVHRHSGSPAVHVCLSMSQEFVKLEVADKGKGIPLEILTESKLDSKSALGVGLRGMAERARQLGGNFEVFASPQGTTVRATVPRQENISASAAVASPTATHSIHDAQGAK